MKQRNPSSGGIFDIRSKAISGLRIFALIAGLSIGALIPPTGAAWADPPSLAALDRLERGEWELRFRPGNERKRICVRHGREFIQLRHPLPGCQRFVVEDLADRVTVQYTCRGHGFGRTHIWRESGQLVQIESQGIVDGQPFQFSAEARRVGNCSG